MSNIMLALIVGAILGIAFDMLALWLPYRINQEESRWIAEVLDARSDRIAPVAFRTMLFDRNYRSPEQWAVILLSIMMVIVFSVHFGWSARSIGLMIFSCGMLTLAIIDQRTKYLPDQLTLPMLWLGLLIQLNPAMQTIGIESAVLGAVFGYLSLWVTAYLFLIFRDKQGVGHGDMKLMALVGAWLGPLSIPIVLLVACLLGLLWQFVAIMRDKAHSQDEFPFGPWIVVSSLAYIFLK